MPSPSFNLEVLLHVLLGPGSLFNYHVDVGSEWTKVCPVSWSLGVREILETLFESLTAPTPNRIPCRNDVCWKNYMQPH